MFNANAFTSFLLLIYLPQVSLASGIFEINFSALTDSLGRDLREDCCAWQNSTPSFPASFSSSINTLSSLQQHQQLQQQQCDPTKCQLILRICVKNYQTQIDPNQCTFGELSAQVMKPHEAQHFYPSSKVSSISGSPSTFAGSARVRQPSSSANIHHQRMLFQQQAPFLSQQQQQQQALPAINPFGYQTSFLASGQARAMRTIAFHQPITFPFNFTWPVSRKLSHVSSASLLLFWRSSSSRRADNIGQCKG